MTPTEFRDLLAAANLSQRGAARVLQVNSRTLRYWCSGQIPIPMVAQLAIRVLAAQAKAKP